MGDWVGDQVIAGMPNSTPVPMLMSMKGAWMLMFHANAFVIDTQQSSPRGGDKLFSTNWFMRGRGSLPLALCSVASRSSTISAGCAIASVRQRTTLTWRSISIIEALNNAQAHDSTGYDAIAWARVGALEKQLLEAMIKGMTEKQKIAANAAYQRLVNTRVRFGAYYTQDDPLRNPSESEIRAMDPDDPDVQLREAFNLEKKASNNEEIYRRVLAIYRNVRDNRDSAPRFVLGRYALNGANGVPKDRGVAEYWLHEAVRSGSKPAQELLSSLEQHSTAIR